MRANAGLERVVDDIRLYWDRYESKWYDSAYQHDARRAFTKYWLANIAGFYLMVVNKTYKDLFRR